MKARQTRHPKLRLFLLFSHAYHTVFYGMNEQVKRLWFFAWCLCFVWSQAQAVSYTVQVAAFSDEVTAKQSWQELVDQGFPAYLISAPTAQGQIYRIRIGTFANREAAALFATSMQGLSGSNPSPALAENIPGEYLFQANLLGAYDLNTTTVQLFPWNGQTALRIQDKDSTEPALYKIDDLEFSAWRATPDDEGWIIRMVSLPLWDLKAPEATQEAREQYRSVVLANIADQLELTPKQVAAFEFNSEGQNQPPYLVLVERWNPETEQTNFLKAIGQEGSEMTAYGPELVRFQGEDVEIPLPEEDQVFIPDLDMKTQDVTGDDWEATSDDDYIKLKTQDPEKEWRVAVGEPIWAQKNLLLARYEEQVLVYRLEASE